MLASDELGHSSIILDDLWDNRGEEALLWVLFLLLLLLRGRVLGWGNGRGGGRGWLVK
jgi:hypothetical protein